MPFKVKYIRLLYVLMAISVPSNNVKAISFLKRIFSFNFPKNVTITNLNRSPLHINTKIQPTVAKTLLSRTQEFPHVTTEIDSSTFDGEKIIKNGLQREYIHKLYCLTGSLTDYVNPNPALHPAIDDLIQKHIIAIQNIDQEITIAKQTEE